MHPLGLHVSLSGSGLLRELLALTFMALLPVVALTVDAAVKALLALSAALVLDSLTFWRGAEAAQTERWLVLVLLLLVHGGLELLLLVKPGKGRVVHPRVEDRNGAADDALIRASLRSEPVEHIVFLFDA